MKKAYLFGIFLLLALFVLPIGIFAQAQTSGNNNGGDPGGNGGDNDHPYHFQWLSHGKRVNECDKPISGVTDPPPTFTIVAVDLYNVDEFNCAVPAVLQIRDKETGTVLGESGDINFRNTAPWSVMPDSETLDFPCHGNATYYSRPVSVSIDVTAIACCREDKSANVKEIELEYEFMVAGETNVRYIDLGVVLDGYEDDDDVIQPDGYDCLYDVFDPVCLGHVHGTEDDHNHTHGDGDHNHDHDSHHNSQNDHDNTGDPDSPDSPDPTEYNFAAIGSLCYTCDLDATDPKCGGLPNPNGDMQGLGLATTGSPNDASREQKSSAANINRASSVNTFPSPFKDQISLEYFSKNAGSIQIEIKSISGSTLISRNQTVDTGLNIVEIDMDDHPSGIYLIRVFDGLKWTTKKIIKSN